MKLADKYRKLGIRTNADQPDQVDQRRSRSAPKASACAAPSTCSSKATASIAVREMILAENEDERKAGARQAAAASAEGFRRHLPGAGRPAGVHPPARSAAARVPAAARQREGQQEVAEQARDVPPTRSRERVHELHEFNPMLGFRGCRLGISYPEITEMQARAIFEAAAAVLKEGIKVKPEIMIPLVGFKKELDLQVEIVHRVAEEVMKETGKKFAYTVGTMIEVPRGALTADEIAETAEFFSFGTNDLTQTCLGMSRDD